jgi:hypothetical protein
VCISCLRACTPRGGPPSNEATTDADADLADAVGRIGAVAVTWAASIDGAGMGAAATATGATGVALVAASAWASACASSAALTGRLSACMWNCRRSGAAGDSTRSVSASSSMRSMSSSSNAAPGDSALEADEVDEVDEVDEGAGETANSDLTLLLVEAVGVGAAATLMLAPLPMAPNCSCDTDGVVICAERCWILVKRSASAVDFCSSAVSLGATATLPASDATHRAVGHGALCNVSAQTKKAKEKMRDAMRPNHRRARYQ